MKKIFLSVIIGLMGLTVMAQAQFGNYGATVGLGLSTINDELSTRTWPVPSYTVGGFITYEFGDTRSILTDHFYLQSGLNLLSRGHRYEYVYELGSDIWIREGRYTAWYAQVPILACATLELPVRQAGHVVGLQVGPAINFGLLGPYNDRKVHPGAPQREENYDLAIDGTAASRDAFSHINRLDISLILGLTYVRGDWTVRLCVDHGFLATSTGEDVLRLSDREQATSEAERNRIRTRIPNGHNNTVLLSLSYNIGTLNK